jgi:IS5 family transposase
VILEESVPAAQKIVSIFETHADILVKSREEVRYGHKICLNVGASGLVLDCVVHDGNPADVTLTVDMIRRHRKQFGNAPEQAVSDREEARKFVKVLRLAVAQRQSAPKAAC